MSTTFTAPTRTRSNGPAKPTSTEPRRRSFTEQRRAARKAVADRSLRTQLVKGRSLVQLVVSSRGKESRWPFVAAFALIAAISVIALLMVNTATAQTSFTEQDLNDELHELTLVEQQLQQQVAAQQAPGELAKHAQELGMQPGSNPGNLVINADGSVTWIEPSPPPAPPAPTSTEPPPAPAEAATPGQDQAAQDQAAQDQAAQDQAAQDQAAQDQAAQNQAAQNQAGGQTPPTDQGQAQPDPAPQGPAPEQDPAQQADQPATPGA